jgi:DNA (cytosine-5)-methyltransferase 1
VTVGSLFAGIGGFDLGFERAGFDVRWQAERDTGAQHVLARRFPGVHLYGDVHDVGDGSERVDVICGGFPCQDVSVAGKREGLSGERTGLFWQIVRIARELQPRWMVLENVPGLLSSHGGRDFYAVLSALAELGFRRAYRILDSRYFGVAQRRRRVFLVLRARDAGDGPASVLFESQSGGGHSSTGDEARADVAPCLESGANRTGGTRPPGTTVDTAETLQVVGTIKQRMRGPTEEVMDSLQVVGPLGGGNDGIGRRSEDDPNLVTYALGSHAGTADGDQTNRSHASGGPVGMGISREIAHSLRAGRPGSIAVTLNCSGNIPERARALTGSMWKGHDDDTDTLIPTLSASLGHHGHSSPRGDGHDPIIAATLNAYSGRNQIEADYLPKAQGVRRLTPLECERLQGFPDGWTCLCGKGHLGSSFCECADSPRYRQLGNAVTVPVAEWIARRIRHAEEAVNQSRWQLSGTV